MMPSEPLISVIIPTINRPQLGTIASRAKPYEVPKFHEYCRPGRPHGPSGIRR
jgi:hypothetical protein